MPAGRDRRSDFLESLAIARHRERRLRTDEDFGPVLVTVEYQVASEEAAEFLKAIRKYGQSRRPDGARTWGIFRDMEDEDRYVETFIVASWAEHLRQHEGLTRADREAEERVQRHVVGPSISVIFGERHKSDTLRTPCAGANQGFFSRSS